MRKPCECSETRRARADKASSTADPAGPTIRDKMLLTAERMTMCLTCRHARTCPMGKADVRLQRRLQDPAAVCPRNEWPAADGSVTVRLTFEGVPFPRRVRRGLSQAWMVFTHHIREDGIYRGCGCVRALMWTKPFLPLGRRGWGRKLAAGIGVLTTAMMDSMPWRSSTACCVCDGSCRAAGSDADAHTADAHPTAGTDPA